MCVIESWNACAELRHLYIIKKICVPKYSLTRVPIYLKISLIEVSIPKTLRLSFI